jgi:hypothetical protein
MMHELKNSRQYRHGVAPELGDSVMDDNVLFRNADDNSIVQVANPTAEPASDAFCVRYLPFTKETK